MPTTTTRQGEPTRDGTYSSHDFDGPLGTEADLTVNHDFGFISGWVEESDGDVYLIREDGGGGGEHFWVKMAPMKPPDPGMSDVSDVDGDEDGDGDDVDDSDAALPESRFLSPQQMSALEARGRSDRSTMARISVRVYYTRDYQAVTPELKGTVRGGTSVYGAVGVGGGGGRGRRSWSAGRGT